MRIVIAIGVVCVTLKPDWAYFQNVRILIAVAVVHVTPKHGDEYMVSGNG